MVREINVQVQILVSEILRRRPALHARLTLSLILLRDVLRYHVLISYRQRGLLQLQNRVILILWRFISCDHLFGHFVFGKLK